MKKLFTLLFFSCFMAIAIGQTTYSRVEISLKDHSLRDLAETGVALEAGYLKAKGIYIGEYNVSELQKLQNAGISYKVLIEDVTAFYQARAQAVSRKEILRKASLRDVPVPEDFNLGSMGGFLTYDELMDELDYMAATYPNLITQKTPVNDETSIEDHPIYYLKLSDNPGLSEDEPQVLYTGLHHAREPGGMMALVFYMYYLLENYDTDPAVQNLVDTTEMYFVPCVNPDGYLYNEMTNPNGGGMWRKNRRNNGNGSYGVDLNRNYGYMWGYDNVGSSGNPYDETYRGTAPFSEPETSIIKEFCETHNFQIAINYHTYSNLLLYVWGYTDEPCEDDALYSLYGRQMTQVNHYTYGPGSTTIYPTNGGSDDWMYGEQETKNKIFAFTPEVGSGADGFWPSPDRIIPHCQENLLMNILAARFAGNYALVQDLTPSVIETKEGDFHFQITRVGQQAGSPFTVELVAVSDNIVSTGQPLVFENMELMEQLHDSISFVLQQEVLGGDTLVFDLQVDNGIFLTHDTIMKIYGTPVVVFADSCHSTVNWTGGWGLTDEDFTSPDYAMTDSPYGEYGSYQNNALTLASSVDLTDAAFAELQFNAKWAIESGYDYVQVLVSDNSGFDWEPLSGRYTVTGGYYQAEGEPLYDGFQNDWVAESVDLKSYLGQEILLRFLLVSDMSAEEDGFYFDDVRISMVKKEYINTKEVAGSKVFSFYPNPTDGKIFFNTGNTTLRPSVIRIYDVKGNLVYKQQIVTAAGMMTIPLKPGVYFYQWQPKAQNTTKQSGKLLVR
jgi:hypothetical protein